MDMARVWPFLWQFGLGGGLCFLGIWCGITSGYIDRTIRSDRRLIYYLVGGYLALFLLYSAFTFWLPNLPAGGTAS